MMAEDSINELKNAISQIRDTSLPHMHKRLDDIHQMMEKISETLIALNNWKIEANIKMGFMGKLLAGLGSIVGAGMLGFGGWLFSQIVDKAGK